MYVWNIVTDVVCSVVPVKVVLTYVGSKSLIYM